MWSFSLFCQNAKRRRRLSLRPCSLKLPTPQASTDSPSQLIVIGHHYLSKNFGFLNFLYLMHNLSPLHPRILTNPAPPRCQPQQQQPHVATLSLLPILGLGFWRRTLTLDSSNSLSIQPFLVSMQNPIPLQQM